MTSFYLDTSVGVPVLLGHPGATSWFAEVTAPGVHEVLSSRLLRTELTRTLDAIHLASALRSGIEDVVVTSHDRLMLTVARALGLAAHDPLTDGSPDR